MVERTTEAARGAQAPRTGVRFVLANCTDSAHAAEYNAWYDAYAADCTRPGLLVNAIRFENPGAAGTDGDPTYMALYDIVTADPATAWPATFKHPARLRADTASEYASTAFRSTYALAGERMAAAPRRARTGATVVLTDRSDAEGQQSWAEAILATGLFQSAAWCRLVEGSPVPPEWLLVLETAEEDPLTVYERALTASAADAPEHRYAGSFRLLSAYPPDA